MTNQPGAHSAVKWLERGEDALAMLVLSLMVLLPLLEIISREWVERPVSGVISMVQHLTLWATFVGAMLAARSDRMLALSTSTFLGEAWQTPVAIVTSLLASSVTALLFVASVQLVQTDLQYGSQVAWGIPVWSVTAIMPLGFASIAIRQILHAARTRRHRLFVAIGLLAPLLFWGLAIPNSGVVIIFLGLLLLFGMAFGMPIFCVIGGAALLLFWHEGTPLSALPGEAYRMATSPMLPAIPLFTLAGYILAEGGANQRLLRLFRSSVGWMPGGLAAVTTLLLAFFTPLTGASGVTILAMGGLLLPMLVKANYPQQHSVGLVTVSGSIGVLFPPSLPVILYAYYAEIQLDRLFVGGLLPGILLVVAVAGWGAWRGWYKGAQRVPFDARKLLESAWEAKWELLLPVVVLGGIFGGFATLVEAAALMVLYTLLIECVVFRELRILSDLPRVAIESATLVGGFMIILAVALGLTNYMVIDQIPMRTLDLIQEYVRSPLLFLLLLNILLIAVGALMDIYSAIIIIVPLIAPMASAYGIQPVHLGVIFLANAQLGYLMPPMGENLFLSAYRFKQSLPQVYMACLPYVVILFITVMLITYVPVMTMGLLEWFDM